MIPRRKPHPSELGRLPEALLRTVHVPLLDPRTYTYALQIARISIDRETSDSIEGQDEGVSEHTVSVLGLRVAYTAIDKGVSARYVPPWLRPDLGPYFTDPELVAQWDTAVFLKIDRLFRNRGDLAAIELWCEISGRRLACVRDSLDLSTPHGKMIAGIHVGMAQAEAEITGGRVRDAQTRYKKKGRYSGGPVPFGHRAVQLPDKTWTEEPHAKYDKVVEQSMMSFVDELKDMSLSAIAAALTIAEVPTSRELAAIDAGRPSASKLGKHAWSASAVKDIFRNRIHIGQAWFDGKLHYVKDEDGNPVIAQRSERIVSDELFFKVQAKLDEIEAGSPIRRKNESPLLHVAYCGFCGKAETFNRSGKYEYQRCAPSGGNRALKCENADVRLDALYEALEEWLLWKVGEEPRVIENRIPGDDNSTALDRVTQSIAAVRAEKDAGLYEGDDASYIERLTGLTARKRALEATPHRQAQVTYQDAGETFRAYWERLDWSERGAWLRKVGVRVSIKAYKRGSRRPPEFLFHGGKTLDDLLKAARELG